MARAERPEAFIGPALREVRPEQALHRGRHLGGGDTVADGPRDRLVPPDGPPHAEVVGVDEGSVDASLLPLDPDVGDPVLPTAVRAAGDVELDVLVEAGEAVLQLVDQPGGEALGLGQGQLAELRARAGHGAPPEGGSLQGKACRFEGPRHRGGLGPGHVGDQQVLHDGCSDLARPVTVGEVRGRPELDRRGPAPEDRGAHVGGPGHLLRVDADVVPVDVVGRRLGHAGRKGEPKALLDRRLEPFRRPAVGQEEELQSRLLPALPEALLVAEQLGHGLQDDEDAVPWNERVEPNAQMGIGREATADTQ